MKPQDSYTLRAARLGAASLCCAGALYLAFDTATRPDDGGFRGSQRARRGSEAPAAVRPVDRGLLGSLPEDWQAQYRGGLLWITHYNPNGTVTDCLAFRDVEDYHGWVGAHPDFCDVNVDKRTRPAPRTSTVLEGADPGQGTENLSQDHQFSPCLCGKAELTFFERAEP